MDRSDPVELNRKPLPTPCFVVNVAALKRNLKILDTVRQRTGCHILLALKGFAMFRVFPLLRETLQGVCASSPHEARLGKEEFGKEVHAFAAAYSDADMAELVQLCDHIVFNSFYQWHRFRPVIQAASRNISCGIRVNPEHSEGTVPIYDPCGPGSRLGVIRRHFEHQCLDGLTGLHFHNLCEQNADALERTLSAFEQKFAEFLPSMQWVNFGGGHHITRKDYDVEHLCRIINDFRQRYDVDVYLEPGEAVALNAGVLITTVLDIVNNGIDIAILDTSAATHMPDVLEMPYQPQIVGASGKHELPYRYRLAGLSCLAGDVIGDYSFSAPLKVGQKLVLQDMAHYTMVKTNTFNGIRLPSIALYDSDTDELNIIKTFGYEDFRNRLS
jgi:carboxynorspermidine decarboxylase